MSGKITVNELDEIAKSFRRSLDNPKSSGKAGEIYQMLKKLNKELDKYDKRKTGNIKCLY